MKKKILVIEPSSLKLFENLNTDFNGPFDVTTKVYFQDEEQNLKNNKYSLVFIDPSVEHTRSEDYKRELMSFLEQAQKTIKVVLYSNWSEHYCNEHYKYIKGVHYYKYICKTKAADGDNKEPKHIPMDKMIEYVEKLVA